MKTPTLKPGTWTTETVAAAALRMANAAGLGKDDCDAFVRTTVRKWEMGDATTVTHDWPK